MAPLGLTWTVVQVVHCPETSRAAVQAQAASHMGGGGLIHAQALQGTL
jgi:hypothetical protein